MKRSKRTEFCQPGELARYHVGQSKAVCLVLSSPAPLPNRNPQTLFQWVVWSDDYQGGKLMYHVPSVLIPVTDRR